MKAAVLGCGAIGGSVAREIQRGSVPGVQLTGVVHGASPDPPDLPVSTLDEALETSDLVIECAGQEALAEMGPTVVTAGCDLLVVSLGAFTDSKLWHGLSAQGPGRLHLCTGAIGGLDLLSAAGRRDGLDTTQIVTTKKSSTLVQPWMDEALKHRIRDSVEPFELLRGPAREVVDAFPRSMNVAASVALAVGNWDLVEATVVADPHAERTSHVITASGRAGKYRFEVRNHASPENPATSAIVPHTVLDAVGRLAAPTGRFV